MAAALTTGMVPVEQPEPRVAENMAAFEDSVSGAILTPSILQGD
jgi:hypothetical protein